MRNYLMPKTRILSTQLQAVELNISDGAEKMKSAIASLAEMRGNDDALNKKIDASIEFGKKLGIY